MIGRQRLGRLTACSAVLAALLANPALAAANRSGATVQAARDAYAQAAPADDSAARPPRIIVRPRPRRPAAGGYPSAPPPMGAQNYPKPYPVDAPGPGYVRACEDWYEEQHRPSGTVIFPRMSCRWVPGPAARR